VGEKFHRDRKMLRLSWRFLNGTPTVVLINERARFVLWDY